jgi:hypothetical protein
LKLLLANRAAELTQLAERIERGNAEGLSRGLGNASMADRDVRLLRAEQSKADKPNGKRPSHNDEHWLEHMVHDLNKAVVDEPVPRKLVDIVRGIPESDPSADALARARRRRLKAEECRTAGESMGTEAARRTLLQLARDYDALAEYALKDAGPRSSRKRDAG